MRASDEKIGPENLGWAKGREDTGDALYILLDLMVQFDSISCPPDSQCPTHEMKDCTHEATASGALAAVCQFCWE